MRDLTRRRLLGGAIGASATAGAVVVGTSLGLEARRWANTPHAPDSLGTKAADPKPDTPVWKYATGSPGWTLPSVSDGVVCVACNVEVVALRASDGTKLWSFPIKGTTAPVTMADGVVYVGVDADTRNVYALRASDGKQLRIFPRSRTVNVSSGGTVYVAGSGIHASGTGIHALHVSQGTITNLWRFPVGDSLQAVSRSAVYVYGRGHARTHTSDGLYALRASDRALLWRITGSYFVVAVVGNIVYAVGDTLCALRASDGTAKWEFPTSKMNQTVIRGIIYLSGILGQGGGVQAIRANDGRQLWEFASIGDGGETLLVIDDIVYIAAGGGGGGGGRIYALRVSDGKQVWSSVTSGNYPPMFTADRDTIFVTDGSLTGMGKGAGGRVSALNCHDGRRVWSVNIGGVIGSPTTANGIVYVTTFLGPYNVVYALSADDGITIWKLAVAGGFVAPQLQVVGRRAYIGGGDGTIYALQS